MSWARNVCTRAAEGRQNLRQADSVVAITFLCITSFLPPTSIERHMTTGRAQAESYLILRHVIELRRKTFGMTHASCPLQRQVDLAHAARASPINLRTDPARIHKLKKTEEESDPSDASRNHIYPWSTR